MLAAATEDEGSNPFGTGFSPLLVVYVRSHLRQALWRSRLSHKLQSPHPHTRAPIQGPAIPLPTQLLANVPGKYQMMAQLSEFLPPC